MSGKVNVKVAICIPYSPKFKCLVRLIESIKKQTFKKYVVIDKEDGVILALGKKAFYEVYPHVMKQLAKSQMLLPKL